ncbi:hypothetical protein BHE74_00044030, partial [Ensete ventricosum]
GGGVVPNERGASSDWSWGQRDAAECVPLYGGRRPAAVLFDRFRGVLPETVGEAHFLVPWLQKPFIFDIRTRPHTFTSNSGTKDLQMATSPSASSPAPTSLNPSSPSSMPTSCSPSGLTSLPSSAAPATSTSCLMTWPSPTSPTVSSSPAPLRRSRWLSRKPSDPNSWSPVQSRSGALPSSAPRVRVRLPSSSPMLPLLRALVSSSSAASRLRARSPPHSPGRPTLSTSREVTTCSSGSTPPARSKAGEGCDFSSCFLFPTPHPGFSFTWNSNLPTEGLLVAKLMTLLV